MRIFASLAFAAVITVFSITCTLAQTAKGPNKCKTSFSECVSKSVKDGWNPSEASRYCAGRPCAQ
jgi:hypothetical protein